MPSEVLQAVEDDVQPQVLVLYITIRVKGINNIFLHLNVFWCGK